MVNVDRSLRTTLPAFVRTAFNRTSTRLIGAGVAAAILTGGVVAPAVAHSFASGDNAVVQTASAGASRDADRASRSTARTPAAPQVAKKVIKAPTHKQLHPRAITAPQARFKPTAEQIRNAKAIVKAGQQMKLPPRAWVIAVATACQESTLRNLGHLGANNDHDSLGLFQQRPSSGWGSPKQITNPNYASKAFYHSLVKVHGWWKMPLTQAAQTVQVSAFPNHYAKWEKQAGDLVLATYGVGPYAKQAATVR
jgi:hypothetical protein